MGIVNANNFSFSVLYGFPLRTMTDAGTEKDTIRSDLQ